MAWLSRVNFTASDVLSYTDLNNLGNDIRAWGGNVNGGGYTLSNVVLSASSGTMATVIGGTGTASTLTLRSTSGVGTTGADIIFQAGNNGATEVMRLQNGGNVGIGTTSPGEKLVVVGNIVAGNTGTTADGYIDIDGGAAGKVRISRTGTGATASGMVFYTQFSTLQERMRILSTGEVGIGTSSPSESLGVNGTVGIGNQATTGTAGALRIVCTGGSNYIQSGQNKTTSSAAPLIFTSMLAGSEWMRIDSSGNVGIGTSSPGVILDVGNGAGARKVRANGGNTATDDGSFFLVANGGTSTAALGNYSAIIGGAYNSDTLLWSANVLRFVTNGSANERMRIDSVGNVKVGGTADRATTAGTNQVVIFNGTAPVGTLANGCSFYSTAGEMRVMDAAGNATLLSPHDSVTNEWIYDSSHTPSGKRLKINVERLLRFINDHFGLDCVHDLMEEA